MKFLYGSNYKEYYFATLSIPKIIGTDFSTWNTKPTGLLSVQIYIPGEHHYATFKINSQIVLIDYKANSDIKETTYQLNSPANISLSIHEANTVNELILDNIIRNRKSSNQLLLATKKIDTDISNFLNSVETLFFENLEKTFTAIFKLEEKLKKDGKVQSINTNFSLDFINKVAKTFKRAFNKSKRLIDINQNALYVPKLLNQKTLIDLNEILSANELLGLKNKLENDLTNSNKSAVKLKV